MITALKRNLPALRVKPATEIKYSSTEDITELLGPIHLADRRMLHVLTLNSTNMIIDKHLVSIGSVDSCNLHPREIFRYALYDSAFAIILVENFPSGNSTPSQEDTRIANDLMEIGDLLDIPVTDHIIISADGCYSFNEEEKRENIWEGDPPF